MRSPPGRRSDATSSVERHPGAGAAGSTAIYAVGCLNGTTEVTAKGFYYRRMVPEPVTYCFDTGYTEAVRGRGGSGREQLP